MAAEISEKQITIKWTGSAGIESAKKLQIELLKAIKQNKKILLDISELEDIDLSAIQLILSAKLEAENQNKIFALTKVIPHSILEFVSGCSVSLDSLLLAEEKNA